MAQALVLEAGPVPGFQRHQPYPGSGIRGSCPWQGTSQLLPSLPASCLPSIMTSREDSSVSCSMRSPWQAIACKVDHT